MRSGWPSLTGRKADEVRFPLSIIEDERLREAVSGGFVRELVTEATVGVANPSDLRLKNFTAAVE